MNEYKLINGSACLTRVNSAFPREQCSYREALFLAQSMGQATCASAGRVMYTIGQALTCAELSFTHTRKGANMPVSPLIRVESGYLLSNGR